MTHASPIRLIEKSDQAEASRLLNDALRRTGMRRVGPQAYELSPSLRDVMLRLSFYLSDFPTNPFTGRPILDTTISAALTAYFSAARPAEQGGLPFLQAATSRAAEVLSVLYVAGETSWDPLGGEPLVEWLRRHPVETVSAIDAPEPAYSHNYRERLLQLLCSEDDLIELRATAKAAATPID